MNKRLELVTGEKIKIVAQDNYFGDAKMFAKSRSDDVTKAQIGAYGNTYTEETVAKYMPEPSLEIGKKKLFSIISKDDGRYLGDIRLEEMAAGIYQIGIVIIQSERNHGYGTDSIQTLCRYAFEKMNAHRVYLRVYQNNPKAKELYIRLGFVYEKTEDDNYVIDGINYPEDWLYLNA